jgi:hypothetical protein
METFLNEHELHEFILAVSTWEGRLHVLDLLAKREARLMNNSVHAHASIVDAPLDFDKTALYEECENVLADMATKLTSHHNAHISECASIILRCAEHLNTLPDFPGLYARFILANQKLRKALTRPAEKKLAGYCVHCNQSLFATEEQKEYQCLYCGTVNDLATVRADLAHYRARLLQEKTVKGSLKQITSIVNIINEAEYSIEQVRRLLKSGVLHGVKVKNREWIVEADSLHLE